MFLNYYQKKKLITGMTVLTLVLVFIILNTAPAGAKIKLATAMTHTYQAEKGETYQGKIKIANTGNKIKKAYIYKRDYFFNSRGLSYYEKPGSVDRSNSNWISLRKNLIQVPPGSESTFYYEMKIPEKDLKGTYWSVIMVEPLTEAEEEAVKYTDFKKGKSKVNIGQRFRYAIQVVTNVGKEQGKIKFVKSKLLQEKSRGKNNYIFSFDVVNTGKVWFNPQLWLEIYNQKGEKQGVYKGEVVRVYPGTSVNHKIKLKNLKPGIYPALLIMDNGDSNIFGIQHTLKIR